MVPRQQLGAQQVRLTADLVQGGANPDAEVMLTGLFGNDRYIRAMRSGFPLHLNITFELRRQRRNWFDHSVGSVAADYVIVHDPLRDQFTIESRAGTVVATTPRELRQRIETTYQGGYPPDREGVYYYRVTVSAETLSDEDVEELYRWLGGHADTTAAESRGFITRAARRVLVQVAPLPREEFSTNTPSFRWP